LCSLLWVALSLPKNPSAISSAVSNSDQPAETQPAIPNDNPPATLPSDPLLALTESLARRPAPADENWFLGPEYDIHDRSDQAEVHSYPDGDYVERSLKWETTILRTRIACLYVSPNDSRHPDFSEAMTRWRQRLSGIIADTEIDVAAKAIAHTRIQFLTHDTESGPAQCFGERFETRARMSSLGRIMIELLWIDLNEPQAKQAFAEFSRTHRNPYN
jgi:hypothetical protein